MQNILTPYPDLLNLIFIIYLNSDIKIREGKRNLSNHKKFKRRLNSIEFNRGRNPMLRVRLS